MSRSRVALAAVAFVLFASPVFADATAFLGSNLTPSNRLAKGLALSFGFTLLGFEAEYTNTTDDTAQGAPSLTTGMLNLIAESPIPIYGISPYVTAGAGFYQEKLGLHDETNAGINLGGGIKFTLTGPLRVRVDYRVFKLGGGALNSPAHRIYAGLNLKF